MGSRAGKNKKAPQKTKVQLKRLSDDSRADDEDFNANMNVTVHDYMNHSMKTDENSYASTPNETYL